MRGLFFGACLIASPTSSWSQQCRNPVTAPSIGELALSVAGYSYATAFAITASHGRKWLGSVTASTLRDRDLRENAAAVGVDVRRVFAAGGSGRAYLCPAVGIAAEFGPRYDLIVPEDDVHRIAWGGGLNGSVMVARRPTVDLEFTATARAWRMTSRKYHLGEHLSTVGDTYGTIRGGVSVRYRHRFTVTAELGTVLGIAEPGGGYDDMAPFGRENHETSLSASVAVAIGKIRSIR